MIHAYFLEQIIFLGIMCITPPPHRVPFLNVVVQAPPLSISKYGIVAMPLLLDLVNEIQCKPHLGRPLTFYRSFCLRILSDKPKCSFDFRVLYIFVHFLFEGLAGMKDIQPNYCGKKYDDVAPAYTVLYNHSSAVFYLLSAINITR